MNATRIMVRPKKYMMYFIGCNQDSHALSATNLADAELEMKEYVRIRSQRQDFRIAEKDCGFFAEIHGTDIATGRSKIESIFHYTC